MPADKTVEQMIEHIGRRIASLEHDWHNEHFGDVEDDYDSPRWIRIREATYILDCFGLTAGEREVAIQAGRDWLEDLRQRGEPRPRI